MHFQGLTCSEKVAIAIILLTIVKISNQETIHSVGLSGVLGVLTAEKNYSLRQVQRWILQNSSAYNMTVRFLLDKETPVTKSEQAELVKKGASKTMNSRHLPQEVTGTSHAVDLMAYVGSRGSWELNLYDDLADAMKEAAIQEGVQVRWGAAWHINDMRDWDGTMEDAMNAYIDLRRSQGRRPFIDGPHFELMD